MLEPFPVKLALGLQKSPQSFSLLTAVGLSVGQWCWLQLFNFVHRRGNVSRDILKFLQISTPYNCVDGDREKQMKAPEQYLKDPW